MVVDARKATEESGDMSISTIAANICEKGRVSMTKS
jgi:hypothetical protein